MLFVSLFQDCSVLIFVICLIIVIGISLLFYFYYKNNKGNIGTKVSVLYIVIFIVVIVSISVFILTFGSEEFRETKFPLGWFSPVMSDWGNYATCLTAIFTAISVILAYKAFMGQQMQLRRASFDSLFTQLMSQHAFLYNKIKSSNEGGEDIFRYYFTRLKETADLDICSLWKDYCSNKNVDKDKRLESYENLKNYFKFIYHEVSMIQAYESAQVLDEKLAKKYVLLIQAHMNNYELLCYMINLIDYYERTSHSNKKYLKYLRKYNFFEDLYQSIYFSGSIKKLRAKYSDCPIF